MTTATHAATSTKQIRVTRRSPHYWRVTIDHPPLNIFGPDTMPQLNEAITALETDQQVKVVVFDSAVEGFFLTHYDFLAPCDPALAAGLPSICRSNKGFDRSAFHERFNTAVVAFFRHRLGGAHD